MRAVAGQLIAGLKRILKEGNTVILRHYDRAAPVGMDQISGEAISAPPYLYKDTQVVSHRVETTRLKSGSVIIDMPAPDQEVPTFTYFVKGHVIVQRGDFLFDSESRPVSSGIIDPEAEGWHPYEVLYAHPHKSGNTVVMTELITRRADQRHV